MRDYISRSSLVKTLRETPFTMSMCLSVEECNAMNRARDIFTKTFETLPAADVVELSRDKLIELLSRYFSIGDTYTYELTRVKEAFEIGTMTFDDFVEWDDDNVADLADWLIKELKEEENDER